MAGARPRTASDFKSKCDGVQTYHYRWWVKGWPSEVPPPAHIGYRLRKGLGENRDCRSGVLAARVGLSIF